MVISVGIGVVCLLCLGGDSRRRQTTRYPVPQTACRHRLPHPRTSNGEFRDICTIERTRLTLLAGEVRSLLDAVVVREASLRKGKMAAATDEARFNKRSGEARVPYHSFAQHDTTSETHSLGYSSFLDVVQHCNPKLLVSISRMLHSYPGDFALAVIKSRPWRPLHLNTCTLTIEGKSDMVAYALVNNAFGSSLHAMLLFAIRSLVV